MPVSTTFPPVVAELRLPWEGTSSSKATPRHGVRGTHSLVRPILVPALLAAMLLSAGRGAAQTSGVWSSTAAMGAWSAGTNWLPGSIADGAGATADFSQQAMTNDILVHLDSSRSIGTVAFGDPGNTFNYTLDNNGTSNNILTLANPTATPITSTQHPQINVNNGTATISGILTGSQGLVVNGGGQTGTLILSGANTFYDSPSEAQSPQYRGGFGAITVDGGLLSIASDVPPGTLDYATNSGATNPSPLGSLPPGSAGFAGGAASMTNGNIWLNGGGLQATATFQLSSWRGIALGSLAGGGGGTINVTPGNTLTYGFDDVPNPGSSDVLVNGVIADANPFTGSSLTLTGGGTLFLTSVNTYTGSTNINGAGFTLQMGIANAVSRFSGVSVASTATFLLNGFSQNVGSLAGAGSVTNNSNTSVTLTIGSDNTNPAFSGVLSNTNLANTGIITTLTKVGAGNQTLATPNSASWSNTGGGGGYDLAGPTSGATVDIVGGTLTIDLTHANTQTNLINPSYALQLGGGGVALVEPSLSTGTSQAFNGTTVLSGGSAVSVNTNGNTSATGLSLGAIARSSGGTVDFSPGPGGSGNIATTTPNGAGTIFGGWATAGGGAGWATSSGGNLIALNSYTNDTWAAGNNTTVSTSNSPASGSTTNSLRFNAPGPNAGGLVVTLTGANTIGSGGILVTANAAATGASITGAGTLTSGYGADLIIHQYDAAGSLTISNVISGSIGVTKSGPGTYVPTANNTYTGTTTINGGTVSVSTDGVGNNAASPLGSTHAAATAGNIVLNGGTLQAAGPRGNTFTLNANRGIARWDQPPAMAAARSTSLKGSF